MSDRKRKCDQYVGMPYNKAKSGEVCQHYGLLTHHCKLMHCECIFNLERKGHAELFDIAKDFGLVYVN